MMDLSPLAAQVAAALAPVAPYLLGKITDAAGQEIQKGAPELAKALWAKLRPAVAARPAAQEAVEEIADHPGDPDAQAVLRVQIRKLLESDAALQQSLAQLIADDERRGGSSVRATASGERSVAIGGSNTGTISTGDQPAHR